MQVYLAVCSHCCYISTVFGKETTPRNAGSVVKQNEGQCELGYHAAANRSSTVFADTYHMRILLCMLLLSFLAPSL